MLGGSSKDSDLLIKMLKHHLFMNNDVVAIIDAKSLTILIHGEEAKAELEDLKHTWHEHRPQ